jgi:hypothetical protein
MQKPSRSGASSRVRAARLDHVYHAGNRASPSHGKPSGAGGVPVGGLFRSGSARLRRTVAHRDAMCCLCTELKTGPTAVEISLVFGKTEMGGPTGIGEVGGSDS